MVSSSCSTSGTRRVNLVANPVISHEWGKDQEVFTTNVNYGTKFNVYITMMIHATSNCTTFMIIDLFPQMYPHCHILDHKDPGLIDHGGLHLYKLEAKYHNSVPCYI